MNFVHRTPHPSATYVIRVFEMPQAATPFFAFSVQFLKFLKFLKSVISGCVLFLLRARCRGDCFAEYYRNILFFRPFFIFSSSNWLMCSSLFSDVSKIFFLVLTLTFFSRDYVSSRGRGSVSSYCTGVW